MGLKRVLTTVDATWLVAGSMIGSGIFLTPGLVAGQLPGAGWALGAWMLGGLVSMTGAAVYGELGSRLPHAGGDYCYLATAYGPLWGFLNGWAAITLTFSAAAAAQTRAALGYIEAAIPALSNLPAPLQPLAAPAVIVLLTAANVVGARVGGKTTAWFTAVPLVVLALAFAFGAFGSSAELQWPTTAWALPPGGWLVAMGAALIPIFFTYSGWNAAAYLTGEMREPGRGLALGLLAGTGLVTVVYLTVNLGLVLVLPAEQLAGSARPAAEAAARLLGPNGERLLASMVAVAILGSANVTLMAGARVYFAMAQDGLAPHPFTRTNRAGVPSFALWLGGAWAAALSLFGTIGDLVGWATLTILLLSSMTVTSLFVLRRRGGPLPRFRCPGYPITPVVFLVASLGAAAASFLYAPRPALIALAIVGSGFPLYPLARRWFRAPGGSGG